MELHRHPVSQLDGTPYFPRLAAEKRIVIINLARHKGTSGRLGLFFAGFVPYQLVSGIQHFARELHPTTGENIGGPGLALFIDEAASVVGHSAVPVQIGAEHRKDMLCQVLGFQDISRFDKPVERSLLTNTSNIIGLQSGIEAAVPLARGLSTNTVTISPTDLSSLPKYTDYARVNEGDRKSPPFSMNTLPPHATYDKWWQQASAAERAQREQWVEEQVARVKERSHALICNPAEEMAARLAFTTSSGDEMPRTAMTAYSLDALYRAAQQLNGTGATGGANPALVSHQRGFDAAAAALAAAGVPAVPTPEQLLAEAAVRMGQSVPAVEHEGADAPLTAADGDSALAGLEEWANGDWEAPALDTDGPSASREQD